MKYYRELMAFIVYFTLWIGGAFIAALGTGHDNVLIFILGIAISFAACGVLVTRYDM
jgi:uncharacterized membrane protein